MKILTGTYIVYLCAVLGFARPDGETTLLEGEDPCPTMGDEGRGFTLREYTSMVSSCVMPDEDKLSGATTTEQFKQVVKGYCDKAPVFQECIVSTRDLAARCLTDPVDVSKLTVRANFTKQLLEVACLQDRARLASILQGLVLRYTEDILRSNVSFVDNCEHHSLEFIDIEAATVSQYSLQLYHILIKFKTCVVDYTNRHEVGLEGMMAVLNEIADKLTCVGEDSAEPILCKTLAAQRCVAHDSELDDTAQQVNNTYVREFIECFKHDEGSSSIVSLFKEARTAEEYKHIFKGICNVGQSARQCIANTKLNGGLCIHGGFLNMFRGGLNIIKIVIYWICEDEGVQLSSILAAVRAAATKSDNFAERCFMAAVEGLKDVAGWNENYRLQYYQVMTNFKNCIADYGREHNQAAVDLVSFLGGSVDGMRCHDGTTDSYVRCNTLVN